MTFIDLDMNIVFNDFMNSMIKIIVIELITSLNNLTVSLVNPVSVQLFTPYQGVKQSILEKSAFVQCHTRLKSCTIGSHTSSLLNKSADSPLKMYR